MYQKRNQKRNEKRKKRNQEEEREEDRRGRRGRRRRNKKRTIKKGMSLVALLPTSLSHFIDYSFTVYRWMKDAGRKMQMMTTENENLNRNLCVKKDKYETRVNN